MLLFFMAAAFLIRVVYVLWAPSVFRFDEVRYWEEMKALLQHGTFLSSKGYAHDMPLTAVIFALIVKFTGTGIYGIKIFLALVSSATVYVIGRLAFLLHPTRATLVCAGTAATCYPFFIYYSSLLLSETFYLFTLSVVVYFAVQRSGRAYLLFGISAGINHLVRPTIMYFMPVIWIWQWKVLQIDWKKITVAAVLFMIVIVPWGLRNEKVLGKFIVGTTGLGQVLWEGNNPWNTNGGTAGEFADRSLYLKDLPANLSEVQRDTWKKTRAVRFIRENPEKFVRLCWMRLLRFWHLWPNFHWYNHGIYKWISLLSFGPILVLSLASLWILRHQWRITGLIWLMMGYYTVVHAVTIGSIRYRLPLEPLLLAMAAAAVAKIFTDLKALSRTRGESA